MLHKLLVYGDCHEQRLGLQGCSDFRPDLVVLVPEKSTHRRHQAFALLAANMQNPRVHMHVLCMIV